MFSASSRDSRWVEAEVSYLTYARIQEGKALIPVFVGDEPFVPPLLRPLARALLSNYLLPFEMVGLLLLAAVTAATVLARRGSKGNT